MGFPLEVNFVLNISSRVITRYLMRNTIRSRIRVILEVELIISCRKIIRSRIRVILEVNNFELLIDIEIRDALQVRTW